MKIVDLSAPLEEDFIVAQVPWKKPFLEIKKVRNIPRDGYQASRFSLTCHTGTHMDAPAHVFTREEKDGIFYIEDWPLEQLYGDTVVLDIPKGELEPITAADFEKASEKLEVREGDIVLVHTGWGRYDQLTLKDRKNWDYVVDKRPGLVLDGAEWLVEKRVKAYGQDTVGTQHEKYPLSPSEAPDYAERGFVRKVEPVHTLLLKNNIVLLEHLTNLDKVANRRITAGFFPLPLRGVEASPMRALAFLED
jgi:kynurenine formamidase